MHKEEENCPKIIEMLRLIKKSAYVIYEWFLSPRSITSDMDTEMVQEQPEVPYKKMKRVESSPNSSRPSKAKIEGENTFLYVESKRAKMEREKEEKRKRAAMEIEFSPQELALATVPGLSFDPRERKFAPDELRPQPIIRKRKKVLTYTLILYYF